MKVLANVKVKLLQIETSEGFEEVVNTFIEDKFIINIDCQGSHGSYIYSYHVFITYTED